MLLVWLTRTTHCRGFGIQSPNDYRFACNVINDHRIYEEYGALQSAHGCSSPIDGKLHRLSFRIARWLKPEVCLNCTSSPDTRTAYITAGCSTTSVISATRHCERSSVTEAIRNSKSIDMACLSAEHVSMDDIEAIMKKCSKRSVMIAEGIKQDKSCREKWRKIADSELTGVTFDLYYCGIAFFDTSRYKQNHIVNF